MKLRVVLPTLLFAGGLLAAAGTAGTAGASHSWGNYHWARSSNSVQLDIGNNVGSEWNSYLTTAISDWNKSAVLELTAVSGQANKNCRPETGRIEVCSGSYGNNGWLGVAQIWASGDHITKASTRLNDFYFSYPQYNTPAWRQMVMCQEIGHDFGLDHQNEDFDDPNLDTCMDYTSNPDTNQHPNDHDYEQLDTLYGHLDGGDGGGGGGSCNPRSPKCNPSPSPAAAAGDSPADWGELVDEHGQQATYVRDFGNGSRVITHVFWAA